MCVAWSRRNCMLIRLQSVAVQNWREIRLCVRKNAWISTLWRDSRSRQTFRCTTFTRKKTDNASRKIGSDQMQVVVILTVRVSQRPTSSVTFADNVCKVASTFKIVCNERRWNKVFIQTAFVDAKFITTSGGRYWFYIRYQNAAIHINNDMHVKTSSKVVDCQSDSCSTCLCIYIHRSCRNMKGRSSFVSGACFLLGQKDQVWVIYSCYCAALQLSDGNFPKLNSWFGDNHKWICCCHFCAVIPSICKDVSTMNGLDTQHTALHGTAWPEVIRRLFFVSFLLVLERH